MFRLESMPVILLAALVALAMHVHGFAANGAHIPTTVTVASEHGSDDANTHDHGHGPHDTIDHAHDIAHLAGAGNVPPLVSWDRNWEQSLEDRLAHRRAQVPRRPPRWAVAS